MATVAVQSGLTPVRSALMARGYRVIDLGDADLGQVTAVVVTGGSDDLLGDERTRTRAPVVVASGRSPAEIVDEIEARSREGA